jgi:WD40 repeat protein
MDGEDVYDLAWSPDGSQLIIGLTDNTAQVWDTQQAKCVKVLKDHQHFVQGVAWDPLDQLLVTQSSDRSVKVWAMRSNPKGGFNYHSLAKYSKLEAVNPDEQMDDSSAAHSAYSMFHDETLVSFFRRPTFSPDGSVLVMPAGQKTPLIASASPNRHGIYLNMRNNLHKAPTVFIGGFEKAAISIRFNPKLFPLIEGGPDAYISLPYRMVFAIVTQNSVYIFDTQNKSPLFMFANLHYASLTDVSWSCDGLKLVASSVDGFCTVSEFEPKTDFLGEALPETEALAYFKEALEVVKSIPFFNPPIPQPRKQHQAISNLENQSNSSFITLSSDLDIMIDNDGDNESRHENDENKEDFTDRNDRNDISNLTKPVTEAVPVIIHNPPVKRRIAPTLLSSSVQKE